MKKLLLIAYYFPPDGGAGTQRPAKFCRYLPEFGWSITVITRAAGAARRRGRWDPEDASLLADITGCREIIRLEGDRDTWLESAHAAAREHIDQHAPDCVLITMSPFWLSQIGRRLRSDTKVPVVYDLRDPWALDGWQPSRTWWHWRKEMRQMRQTLDEASGMIANTPEAGRRITDLCHRLPASAVAVIPNGYDAEDFRLAGETDSHIDSESTPEFRIVHSGTLHGGILYERHPLRAVVRRWLEYSPERLDPVGRTIAPLLGAVTLLRQRSNGVLPLRIILVGAQDEGTRRCVAESGVEDAVTCTGFVTHIESIRWLLRADALFLPLHDLPVGSRSLIVPGKTYEYLATGKPILAALPQGDARDLVCATPLSYPCSPTDAHDIAATLERLLSDWRHGRFTRSNPSPWVERYGRRQLCARLDQFLRQIAASTQTAPNVVDPLEHGRPFVEHAS